MEFGVNLTTKNAELIEESVEIGFIEGFYYNVNEIASALDDEVDDMISYSLVEKEAKTFFIIPNGDCTANIYHIKDADLIESIKQTIEEFEEY